MGSVTVRTLRMRKLRLWRDDLPRPEGVCEKSWAQKQSSQAAETPKPPVSAPPRSWQPAPARQGVRKSPSRRHGHLLPPGPRTSLWVHMTLGSLRPLHPSSPNPSFPPAAQARPARSPNQEGRPVPQFAPPAVPAGADARNGWGKGPREAATRHSRVELVVHPLAAAVTTASRSDFRSARSFRLGSDHFRLRGAQRNVGELAGRGAGTPGRSSRAVALSCSGSVATRAAGLGSVPVLARRPPALPRGARADPLPRLAPSS